MTNAKKHVLNTIERRMLIVFDPNKEIYNLMEELRIFTEARTGQQKKAHQKINRRKREERQRNERDFKSKLNFSHTGYGKDGSEYGTIKIGDKTADIQLHHHSSAFKHNPAYSPYDSKVHLHKINVNTPSSYTYGAHELSHADDDNKTPEEKTKLKSLINKTNQYADTAKNPKVSQKTRDEASKKMNMTMTSAMNKYNELSKRREVNIVQRDNNSDTVKRVQRKIQQITKRDGASPVNTGHDDKGAEIRADELVLKSFKGSAADLVRNLNKLSDANIRKEGELIRNPKKRYSISQEQMTSGEIYKKELLRINRDMSLNASNIFKIKEKLKNINTDSPEYSKLQQKVLELQNANNWLKNERRHLKSAYNNEKVKRTNMHNNTKQSHEEIRRHQHNMNLNRINIVKDNMR